MPLDLISDFFLARVMDGSDKDVSQRLVGP